MAQSSILSRHKKWRGFSRRFPLFIMVMLLANDATVFGGQLLDKANSIYNNGGYAKAITLYKAALHAGENPTLGYFNLANCYFQLDSLPQSIVYYRATVEEAPDFFRGHLNLAIASYALDDMGNCIASISRALEIEPENMKALLIRAAAYRKTGAYPEAITAFERILEIDRSNNDICIALGEMFRDLGDHQSACYYLEQYPETGANYVYALSMIADMYESDGYTEKTVYYLQKIIGRDPLNRWHYYRKCTLHEKSGNHLLALEEAKSTLLQFPDFGEVALFAGNCAFSLDRLSEAEYYFTIAKELKCPGAATGLDNIEMVRNRQTMGITYNTDQ